MTNQNETKKGTKEQYEQYDQARKELEAAQEKFYTAGEEAVKFLEFATSYKIQKEMAMHLGWNPGRMDLYSDKDLLEINPALTDLRGIFINAIPRPMIPYYSELSQVMQKHLSGALANQTSAKEALKSADSEMHAVINRYQGE